MNEYQSLASALQEDFQDITDVARILHVAVRLGIGALLGGLIGYQREKTGKSAGLRTHMLVTMGAAFFVVVPQLEKMESADLSRVIQGIVAGIGFLGGGAILKLADDKEIHGLTTAAGIWFSAAIGIAVGFGRLGTAIVGAILAFIVLEALHLLEKRIAKRNTPG
ncbi:MAG: MgtC/SapB family protein [Pirellulales bacterium]